MNEIFDDILTILKDYDELLQEMEQTIKELK